jgi:aminoglycoside phosphotransferase (APT) family kinase protein
LVVQAVATAVGPKPLALFQMATKLPRVVFEAKFANRTVFFKAEVRNEERDYALALEAWTMECARKAGMPVADVLHLDCSEKAFPFRFMVMSALEGAPLQARGLDMALESRVLRNAGELLRGLHEFRVQGFARLDEDLYLRTGEVRGNAASWATIWDDDALEAITLLARSRVLDGALTSAALRRLKEGASLVPHLAEGRLLHGDFDRSHIFVDGHGRLSGIIDFGDRESGDPEWELSGMWLWDGETYLAPVIEGYRAAGGMLNDDLVGHYGLIRLLRLMRRRLEAGRLEDVEFMKLRLTSILST